MGPERELKALREIINSLGTSFEFDEVANKVVLELKEIVDFDRASMGLLDKKGERIMVYALHLDIPSQLDAGRPIKKRERGMWSVVSEAEPKICDDMKEEEMDIEESRILVEEGIRSYITFPLIVDDKVEGVVNFGSSTPGGFREEQKEILWPGVRLIARALKGSRAETQLNDSILKMRLVDRISNMARTIEDDEVFLRKVLKEAQEAFGQFNFVYFEVREEEGVFRIMESQTGFQYTALKDYKQPIDKGILGKVYRTMSAWVVPDADKQEGFVQAPDCVIKAEISTPSVVDLKVRGILSCITPYPFSFKAYEVWVVKQLADIIGKRLFGDEEKHIPRPQLPVD